MRELRRVCVFCGAREGRRPSYATAARTLGAVLADQGVGLVFGGSSLGLMSQVADAVLEGGGEAIGVIPEDLLAKEVPRTDLTELEVVGSMHERKARMFELSDAFVALPGGLGTLEELAEIVTWAQLGLHDRPIGVLDVDGYFASLIGFVDHAVDEGFVSPAHRDLLTVDTDTAQLLQRLRERPPSPRPRWVDSTRRS